MSNKQQSIQLLAVLQEAVATFEVRLELYDHVAKELRAKYEALIENRFTPEQALEIIKARAF